MSNTAIPLKKVTDFNSSDLAMFLSSFGRNIGSGGFPVCFPSFAYYFQDMNGGGSRVGNLTLLNGERMFLPDNPDASYPDFAFAWSINGVLLSNDPNPRFSDIEPECDGIVLVKYEMLHKPTQMYYTREIWSYHGWNNIEDCPTPPPPAPQSPFEVFIPFYPAVNPVEEYTSLLWDFDNDGSVTVNDLMTFLSRFSNSESPRQKKSPNGRNEVDHLKIAQSILKKEGVSQERIDSLIKSKK